jgi:hypothetical protein
MAAFNDLSGPWPGNDASAIEAASEARGDLMRKLRLWAETICQSLEVVEQADKRIESLREKLA